MTLTWTVRDNGILTAANGRYDLFPRATGGWKVIDWDHGRGFAGTRWQCERWAAARVVREHEGRVV